MDHLHYLFYAANIGFTLTLAYLLNKAEKNKSLAMLKIGQKEEKRIDEVHSYKLTEDGTLIFFNSEGMQLPHYYSLENEVIYFTDKHGQKSQFFGHGHR